MIKISESAVRKQTVMKSLIDNFTCMSSPMLQLIESPLTDTIWSLLPYQTFAVLAYLVLSLPGKNQSTETQILTHVDDKASFWSSKSVMCLPTVFGVSCLPPFSFCLC